MMATTMTSKKEKNQQIQVFVRVRPLNAQEGTSSCVEIKGPRDLAMKHSTSYNTLQRTFQFDKVFGPESKQIDVYKMVAQPLVQEVISGYNCTILAYGQTGTGKTYTMAGGNIGETVNWSEDVHSGIIPRTLSHLFDLLNAQKVEHTVRISYLELYNEEIFDLLSSVEDNTKLKLYDDNMKKGSVIVHGLTETTVDDKAEVFRILEKGAEKRKVASTLMNAQSSRSHTVFIINVHTKENSIDGEDLLKTGKLYLVDLAGSENIKHSGVTEGRARETFSINQSLLTLGRCINKLTDRSSHIPYRESKLTRLLQDSLGGRTKTTLIATISPAYCSYDESMNTLDYAHRAKHITNKPEINQRLSKKALLREYTEEIDRLRRDLQATRAGKGIFVDEENYEAIMRERDIHKSAIADKMSRIQILQEEMSSKEQLCEQLKICLEEQEQEVKVKINTIISLETQLQEALRQINELRKDCDLSQYMVDQLSQTERQLQSTARELLSVADTTTRDTSKLHDKVEVLTDLNKQNKQAVEMHFVDCNTKIDNISQKIEGSDEQMNSFLQTMRNKLLTCSDTNTAYQDTFKVLTSNMNLWCSKYTRQINDMESGFESFRVSSELAQINTSTSFRDMFESCRAEYNNLCVTFVKYLIDLGTTNTINFNDLLNNIDELMQQNLKYSNRFATDIGNTVSEDKQNIKNILDSCRSLEDKIESRVKEHGQREQNYIQLRNNQFEELNKLIACIKNTAEEHDKGNAVYEQEQNENRQALKCGLDESAQKCTSSENVQKLITQNNVTLATMNNEQSRVLEAACKANRKTQDKFVFAVGEISVINEKYVDLIEKCTGDTQEVLIKEIGVLQKAAEANYELYHSSAVDLMNTIVDVNNDLEKDTSELNERMCILLDDMREVVEENAETQKQTQSSMSTEIDSCREGMRRLFSGSLKEYKATGETPQRKTYQYPRSLAQTKPRDILVEEFHQRCQDIPEGDEKENEPNNINSTNTSKIPTLQSKNTNTQKDQLL